MPRNKSETLSIRTTAEIKDLVRKAADHEHRSVASMIEMLILNYAKQNLPSLQEGKVVTKRNSSK